MEKRWRILGTVLGLAALVLIGRLAYIQLIGHDDLSDAASMQHHILLEGADTRGLIYDRNGTPLAGASREYIYIFEEDRVDGETRNALAELDAEEIYGQSSGYRVFSSGEYDKGTGERLIRNSGAYILEADRRYRENQPAVHMIGYVNPGDGNGASGLELMYDEVLSSAEKEVSAAADVYGNLLQGYGLKVETEDDDYTGSSVTTTLELGLQKRVEDILQECPKDAAAVVLECGTGEILAAACTPVFDPRNIKAYMESNRGELINRVTQGEYPPGSVFKIAVAAAALEAGVSPDTVFNCEGSIEVRGHTVKCSTGGENGHGEITFEEAFADSCNCAFIELGQLAGSGNIITAARELGLGSVVLDGFPGEKSGNIMSAGGPESSALANLSIGQGETLTTPLQIAAMTGIIANGGTDTGVRIVRGESDGTEGSRVISSKTAETIQKMMIAAAEYGTGKDLEMNVTAGIKTGSAESVQSGTGVIHGWITGFIPAEDPEYVITVFVEDGRSGRSSAGPVFAEIADYMEENGFIKYETEL